MSSSRCRFSTTACLALLFGALSAGLGCEKDDEPTPEIRQETAPPETAPPEGGPRDLFTRSQPFMGTVFIIKVDAEPTVAAPAIEDAFHEIGRLEHVLSEWRDDSEISRINDKAGVEPVAVGEDTFRVIKAGVDVSRWSEGAFDLSWAALRGLYDFRPGRHRIPRVRDLRRKLPLINWENIRLDEEARTVFLTREGMAIGTGGIAKGYALDRAGEILRAAGIESYMLFGGGQVQVHGMRGDRAWRVGIQHPRRDNEYFAFFESTGGSISTSGDYEHAYIDARGKRWHHILNPRSGLPVDHTVSVTFTASSGLYADALSTASFVLGPQKALEMIARVRAEQSELAVEAAMLDDDCKFVATDHTAEHMQFRIELVDDVLPGCD